MSGNNIEEYDYDLPSDRIALHPLSLRSDAKLLLYDKGSIEHQIFNSLPLRLKGQLIVFNNSKVIPARIYAQTVNGNKIEIFLLQPVNPPLYAQALQAFSGLVWKCQIGHKRKWKTDEKLMISAMQNGQVIELYASYDDRENDLIVFEWSSGHTFSDILQIFGHIPLPPYIKRKTTETDKQQYQTVYSIQEGSVAAPTAGLHFTDETLQQLVQTGNSINYVTLHVSAGTFRPITEKDISLHKMHAETFSFTADLLLQLAVNMGSITAVGTTSLRVIESIYWLAVLHTQQNTAGINKVEQNCWKNKTVNMPATELLYAYYQWLAENNIPEVIAETEIFITPGYTFRLVNNLITNFHMPKSTLICLVAAFVGDDWKRVYDEALKNNYRFLSYGDSSLLMPKRQS